MILNEDYGNLNMLDKGLLFFTGKKDVNDYNAEIIRKSVNLKNTMISPNSRVEIDPVKPHSMKRMLEILNDEKVAAIVFRLNHKQICLITSMATMYDSYYPIIVKYSSFSAINLGIGSMDFGDDIVSKCNDTKELKKLLDYAIRNFQNVYNLEKKPKWDIIVIYKDIEIANKWVERDEAKKGYIPTPKEKERYRMFLLDFQKALNEKRKKWVEEHKLDAQNVSELRELLYKQCNIKKIKYKGEEFNLINPNRASYINQRDTQSLLYERKNQKPGEINYISIKYKYVGLNIKIEKILGAVEDGFSDDYTPLT